MSSSSFSFNHARNRTADYTFTLYEVDGTTGIILAATDVVRFKLYRGNNDTPILDLKSGGSPTPNGSQVTITQLTAPAMCVVRLAQGDVQSLFPMAYEAEVIVVDDSLTSPVDGALSVQRGIVNIMGAPGGPIDKTS